MPSGLFFLFTTRTSSPSSIPGSDSNTCFENSLPPRAMNGAAASDTTTLLIGDLSISDIV